MSQPAEKSPPPIVGTVRLVPIGDVRPNPWNPNVQSDFVFEKERASIREFGFLDPVTVRSVEGGYEIVDGEHRWKAAKLEGLLQISVNDLGLLDDARAKALTDILNQLHGEPDRKKHAELIVSVLESLPDFASILPYTADQLDGFRQEVEFNWSELDTTARPHHETKGLTQFVFMLGEQDAALLKDALDRARPDSKAKDAVSMVAIAKHYLASTPTKRTAPTRRTKAKPEK